MAASSSRFKSGNRGTHNWNSLDNYQKIHQVKLENHPFVDHSKPDSIQFDFFQVEDELLVTMSGEIYCLNEVVLEVEKYMETRRKGGQLQVQTFSFRYNAHIKGKHTILRYDNGHPEDPLDEFHRHVFDLNTSQEIEKKTISIREMPVLSEVLDELEMMFTGHSELLAASSSKT